MNTNTDNTAELFTQGNWEAILFENRKITALYAVRSTNGRICNLNKNDYHELNRPEAEANANLIAAAPEMYHALKSLVEVVNQWAVHYEDDSNDEKINAGIEALRKANPNYKL